MSKRKNDDDIFLDRRTLLRIGASGFMAALIARAGLAKSDPSAAPSLPAAKAKACILLWLNGGPSHIDTFDPKPGKSTGGPFKAIKTKAPAVELCEHLPLLAEEAHRIAVLRGMTSREGNHQRAQFLVHTGYAPSTTIAYPSLGAWTSSRLGAKDAELPAFVSVGGTSYGAGFLGVQNGPFVIQKAGGVPANAGHAPGVDQERFNRRVAGLDMLESRFSRETGDAKVEGRRAVYDKALRLMRSPKLKAFDIGEESDGVRSSYGGTDFGRGCLLARRLVENGVRFVEVVLDGWDTHRDNFTRTKNLMNTLNPAIASLLRDLSQRGLLDTTLVACMGEFGRTPVINANDGRDHHPQA